MSPSSRKTLWWSLLAMNIVPSVLCIIRLIYMASISGLRINFLQYWLPGFAFSLTLTLLARFKLRACYRDEPNRSLGHWQLSIADFYATIVLTAALLSAFRALWPNQFEDIGAMICIILGIGFLVAILVATRRGLQGAALKWLCALSLLLKTIGLITLGALVNNLFSALILNFVNGSRFSYVSYFLEIINVFDLNTWQSNAVPRGLLLCLPLGIVIGKTVNARLAKTAEPQPAS